MLTFRAHPCTTAIRFCRRIHEQRKEPKRTRATALKRFNPQKFLRVLKNNRCGGLAAKHASHLPNTPIPFNLSYRTSGASARDGLGYTEMPVAEDGRLWQMGDGDNLMVS